MEDQSAGQIQLGRARSDALRKLVDRGAAEPVGKGGQLGMLAQLWQSPFQAQRLPMYRRLLQSHHLPLQQL